MKERWWIVGGGAAALALALVAGSAALPGVDRAVPTGASQIAATAGADQEGPLVTLYKNPTCACCADWADHMRENGFRVDVQEGVSLAAMKKKHGVPFSLASCHTAVVDGYALEGHVPADLVRELLEERPEVAGLAVPGMPAGVPGMPEAGPNRAPYEVVAFGDDGSTRVYATR